MVFLFWSNLEDLRLRTERDRSARSAPRIKPLGIVINYSSIFSFTQNKVGKMGSVFDFFKISLGE